MVCVCQNHLGGAVYITEYFHEAVVLHQHSSPKVSVFDKPGPLVHSLLFPWKGTVHFVLNSLSRVNSIAQNEGIWYWLNIY